MLFAFGEKLMFETFLILSIASFGEVVHIKLAHERREVIMHERREVIMLEVPGKDLLSKLVRSVDDEAVARRVPEDSGFVDGILKN